MDYLNYFVTEKGDDVAVENLMAVAGLESGSIPAGVVRPVFKFHLRAGYGGYPLVGDTRADHGQSCWAEVPDFIDSVVPLMEQACVRGAIACRPSASMFANMHNWSDIRPWLIE